MDDRYFRELTLNLAQTSLTNLSQQGGFTYNGRRGHDGVVHFTGFAQRLNIARSFRAICFSYERLHFFLKCSEI